ncbi:putative odorant receptor 69a [Anopheles nili]|uniref:putative odorant receptor 69a n=1 Tax=Anopheles nili TaxID=185578 RepID=UPI00237BBB52|nr:putative odorant receptor 69a [Anopheles nili]
MSLVSQTPTVTESIWSKIERLVCGENLPEEVYVKGNFAYLSTSETPLARRFGFYLLDAFFVLQTCTIVADLATVLSDIGLFGDNMCILAGLLMMLSKRLHCATVYDELDECVEQLQVYHERYRRQGDAFVREMRRRETQERLLQNASKWIATILGGCLIVNGLFSHGEKLILRASYPFSTATPLGYGCVILCQAFLIGSVLFNVLFIDSVGTQVFSQMGLIFDMQCMEFEMIGIDLVIPTEGPLHGEATLRCQVHGLMADHQQLLAFCNRVKRLFEPNIMVQFVCSLLIICLTAFELMFTKGDPMQMLRFGAYMLTAFYQIFLWSFFGNLITHTSTGVSDAMARCNWLALDDALKKDLQFTMMRAQRPFIIDVYRLFPLTYDSFIAILSRSYSICTLLRTMVE